MTGCGLTGMPSLRQHAVYGWPVSRLTLNPLLTPAQILAAFGGLTSLVDVELEQKTALARLRFSSWCTRTSDERSLCV